MGPTGGPDVAAAWGVAFALAMGELPAANQVYPPGTTLLSTRVWGLLHTGVESKLAGIGLATLAAVAVPGWVAARGLARYRSRWKGVSDGDAFGAGAGVRL